MNINFFRIIPQQMIIQSGNIFRSHQTFIIKSSETQHLQRSFILFSLTYGNFRSFGAPHYKFIYQYRPFTH